MFKVPIFALILLTSFESYACSCGVDLKTQVNSAENIFLAKAVSTRFQIEKNSITTSSVEVNFEVFKNLKGKMPSSTVLKSGGPCGVKITDGQVYIIFLGKNVKYIKLCDGSHELFLFEKDTLPEEILSIVKDSLAK